jgi:DNA-binding LacI/PurR family transcriptional regulator
MVLLFRDAPRGMDVPCVNFDNHTGVRLLVDHLIRVHGRQRIVFLQGPEGNQDSELRERSYRETLEAHGIDFDPALVGRGGYNEPRGQAAVVVLLRRGVQFDALFAGDDEAAIGAMSALRNAGLRVPEDVAVVGFDDLPVARHLNPPLTTVRAPIEQAGFQAAQQLFRLLETGEAQLETLLPVELVIRRSCGCT